MGSMVHMVVGGIIGSWLVLAFLIGVLVLRESFIKR